MHSTRFAEALTARTAAFAETVAGADPAAPVPTCPDWPLRVLVGHIGQAHRWSAGIVRSGPSPVPDRAKHLLTHSFRYGRLPDAAADDLSDDEGGE